MEDVFRKRTTNNENNDAVIYAVKSKAEELYTAFGIVDNREMELAKTNLEQAVMWAIKAITK